MDWITECDAVNCEEIRVTISCDSDISTETVTVRVGTVATWLGVATGTLNLDSIPHSQAMSETEDSKPKLNLIISHSGTRTYCCPCCSH
jgi:hypothetical protein